MGFCGVWVEFRRNEGVWVFFECVVGWFGVFWKVVEDKFRIILFVVGCRFGVILRVVRVRCSVFLVLVRFIFGVVLKIVRV